VYDGIDVAADGDAQNDRLDVRREFGIPADAPLVGMLARVAPQKDYPTLARAALRVLREVPGARFMVAGDYDAEANRQHYAVVRKALEDCGVSQSFVFTGQRHDVQRLLSAFDVFVLSTHWEGLPLVILEAMSHGKPVVATAVDGIPEVVEHERTGLLFPHEDDLQLGAHILALLRDPVMAARLGEAGRRLVQTKFTRAHFAASMSDVYARLLEA
jgi:glycosyltransferase involved in cell wall biosynthesis